MVDTVQKIYSLIIDAGGAKAGADLFKRAADQMSQSAKEVAAAGKPLNDNVAAAEKAYQRLVTRIDPVTTAQVRMAKEIEVVQRAFNAQKISVDEAAARLQQISLRYDVAIDRAKRFGAGLQGGTGIFARYGTTIQNAGYQIGDFAVQVAGGTSATRAMSQQLPQLLGSFGVFGSLAGAAVAGVAALAPAIWAWASANDSAAGSQEKLNTVLKDMIGLQEKIEGNAKRSRDSLQAQLDYDLGQIQAQYDRAKKQLESTPKTTVDPNNPLGVIANPDYGPVHDYFVKLEADLQTAKQAAGQFSDSFAKMGTENTSGGLKSTAKSVREVTDAMEEELRVLREHKTAREADAIVDQKLADLGFTRASANQELIDTLTDLATKQVQQKQANKDQEAADRKTIENTKAVAGVLAGLKKQYDDLTKAPVQLRAENLFAGKDASAEDLKAAEDLLNKIDAYNEKRATSKAFEQEIDQLIEEGTRGFEQRQKWEQTSLASQQDQIDLLQQQLGLVGANDNEAQLAIAHLKAQQEVHAQMGNILDENARKYIENADRIAKMNLQLQRQRAAVQDLGNIFGQVSQDIGDGLKNAATSGEAALHSLRDVGLQVAEDLYDAFYKLAVTNPLQNFLTGSNNSTLSDVLSAFGSIASSWFGGGSSGGGVEPARAAGGPVSAGEVYRVNENGQEYFRPKFDGTIIPVGMTPPANANASGAAAPIIIINDMRERGADIEQDESTDASGRQQIRFWVRDEMKSQFQSGAQDRTMKGRYGINAVPQRRRS